jgi:sensor domain CHASE-containing protein
MQHRKDPVRRLLAAFILAAALTVGVDVTVHADRFRLRAERELVAQVIAV